MDQIRRALATVGKQLGQLGTTQKLLIASLAVIVLMVLFVVSQYASKPKTEELALGQRSVEEIQAAMATLRGAGIEARMSESGAIVVPVGRRSDAMSKLGEARQLPADSTFLFRDLIQSQNWWASREQNTRNYHFALRNELGRQIGSYSGVKSAEVNLDIPENTGLGAAARKPTASVSVVTTGGVPLAQSTVDAIAVHVAGAVAGLDVDRVRVIDAANGRQRKPSTKDDLLPTTYLEQATRVETQTREKLLELLSYIPGVVVAVTAQVDVTQVNAQVQKNLDKGEGTVAMVKKETNSSTTQNEPSRGAEPGLRSNTGADLARASSGAGSKLEQTQDDREMENFVGTRTERIIDPRGMPTRLAVSVNVPQGYVVQLLQKEKAAAAGATGAPGAPAGGGQSPNNAAPTDAEIEARFAKEQAKVVASLTPHVKTVGADGRPITGDVVVSMIPMDAPPAGVSGGAGGAGAAPTGGVGGLIGGLALGGSMIDKVVLGALALVALFMMLSLVRRAARRVELPTAEELVGVPPTLTTPTDMVGEADEGETALAGIEVNESEMRSRKILESVGEMVKQDPESAAKLVNRWMATEA